MEANIWVWSFGHVSTPKKKPIEIRNHEIEVKTIPKIKKLEMQYMDKTNGKHFKLFEIKMAWWLAPFPSPKEMKL
jgi:hypothetical protein